jgi:mono/diheme cytochrome c family protein
LTPRRVGLLVVAATAVLSLGWATGLWSLPWSRDLDYQPAIKPQSMPIQPPDGVVPITGKVEDGVRADVDKLHNGVSADTSSVRKGSIAFQQYCRPCHGPKGEGNGTVAKYLPIPPANLTDATLQSQRSDGSIYFTVRHGNVIMPGYAYALTPQRAWDLVNYVRTLKKP